MGGDAHIVVVGADASLIEAACERLGDLEGRWSRFRTDSEVTLLNGMPNVPVIVSSESFELISKAIFAWQQTRGRFDPTVLEAVIANGYDRSFEFLADDDHVRPSHPGASPGCWGIEIDAENLAVTLPHGVMIDPGGIGKGLAADIVVRELMAAGAGGAMVNLGGDVRVAGHAPEGEGWTVAVEDPFDASRELTRVHLSDGAVVTSSRLVRRWNLGEADLHHLIDPQTGLPFDGDVAAVTVVAGDGWWAEAMAKAVFAAGADHAADVLVNAAGIVVDRKGGRHATPGFSEVAA